MSQKQLLLSLSLICLATIISYFSSIENSFTYLDDQVQVVNNPNIKELNGKSITAIFSSTSVGMYQPVTSFIYAVVYQLSGLDPTGYHLASLLVHLLNILLLFKLLKQLGVENWMLVLLCSIFALHPMQVESVSWISAFSNLCFSFFYLLALLMYCKFLNSGGRSNYILAVFAFVLSCLSKSTAVSLPLILILLDYREFGKFRRKDLFNKIPFLLLSIVFTLITIQSREAAGHLSDLSVNFGGFDRLFLISYSILFYPFKFLWGFDLSAFYPYPELEDGLLPLTYYLSFLILAVILWLLYKYRAKQDYWIFFGIYLMMIAPTLHFIPVGNQLTADRYIYLPMIGLLLLLGLLAKGISNRTLKILSSIMIIGLSLMSYSRSKVWKNDQLIWEDVIQKHPNVAQAYNNLGSYLLLGGQQQEAFRLFDKAVQLKPYYADAYNNRGNLYSQAGQSEKAMNDFNKALELRRHADAYFNRANELSKNGNFQLAIQDYTESILLQESPDSYTNRAFARLNLEQDQEAVADLKKAIELQSNYHQAYFLLAMEARKRVNFEEACSYLLKAAQFGNKKAEAGYKELCQNN